MASSSRRNRKPLGNDLFDEPYCKDPYAPAPHPSLPAFTPETHSCPTDN